MIYHDRNKIISISEETTVVRCAMLTHERGCEFRQTSAGQAERG